jgi:hypothetical protein
MRHGRPQQENQRGRTQSCAGVAEVKGVDAQAKLLNGMTPLRDCRTNTIGRKRRRRT